MGVSTEGALGARSEDAETHLPRPAPALVTASGQTSGNLFAGRGRSNLGVPFSFLSLGMRHVVGALGGEEMLPTSGKKKMTPPSPVFGLDSC